MKIQKLVVTIPFIMLLTGCVDVPLNPQFSDIPEPVTGRSGLLSEEEPSRSPGLRALAGQVLGVKEENASGRSSLGTDVNEFGENPLPPELAKTAFVRKVVESEWTRKKVVLNEDDFDAFSKVLVKSLDGTYKITSPSGRDANTKESPIFIKMLKAYYQAYFGEGFVSRTGIVLSKSELKIDFKDGKITGSVDNDTLTGLIAVFMEALYDIICPTPIFYVAEETKVYEPVYLPTTEKDKDDGALLQVRYKEKSEVKKGYLTESDKKPSAAAFMKGVEVGDKTPITKQQLKFMRYASSLSGEQSKNLAGLILRSLGKINAGLIVEGGFSIGDNTSLLKIAETSLEVSTRRSVEYGIYCALKNQSSFRMADSKIVDMANQF